MEVTTESLDIYFTCVLSRRMQVKYKKKKVWNRISLELSVHWNLDPYLRCYKEVKDNSNVVDDETLKEQLTSCPYLLRRAQIQKVWNTKYKDIFHVLFLSTGFGSVNIYSFKLTGIFGDGAQFNFTETRLATAGKS